MTGFYWIYESSESTGFQLDSRVTGLDSATQLVTRHNKSIVDDIVEKKKQKRSSVGRESTSRLD
jgi:hypothetical protein